MMRWDLVERWCSYDSGRAGDEFERLVQGALHESMEQLRAIA